MSKSLYILSFIFFTITIYTVSQDICNITIKKQHITITPEKLNNKCFYKIRIKNIDKYSRTLFKIPPAFILNKLNKYTTIYNKVIKKLADSVDYFSNLLKSKNNRDFNIYIKSTIANKKEDGIKLLIGLLLHTTEQKNALLIFQHFLGEETLKVLSNNIELKNIITPILAIELYNKDTTGRKLILEIFTKLKLSTSFLCKRYREENLNIDELHTCLSNFDIQDLEWIKNILYDNFSYLTKAHIVNTVITKKIGGFEKILIDYAKKELYDKKTDKDAVELFRFILAYLGEIPTNNGLEFASEVALNTSLPWTLRHEAITNLDKMKEFSNETFFIFIKALKDNNNHMRLHAANYLGNLLLDKAIPYLKKVAKNDIYTIARAYALESIAKIAQKKENKFILQFLKDSAPLVQLVALQSLLKNHYRKINLSPLTNIISKEQPLFLSEDIMAKTLAFEILQEFASPELTPILINALKKENDINVIYLINNTLNSIFSTEYILNQEFNEDIKNNMVTFWNRIYNIYKFKITKRVALNANALKKHLVLLDEKRINKQLSKITIKNLFISYTNNFFSKIKNFINYNVFLYVNNEKIMSKEFPKDSTNFTFSFIYPKEKISNITVKININGRIFKQTFNILN